MSDLAYTKPTDNTVFANETEAFLLLLEKNFYGETVSSPEDGTIQVYEDAGRAKGRVRYSSAWAQMILTHLLEEDLDCALYQAKSFRFENTGAAPTPGAGTQGQTYYNTALKQVGYVTDTGAMLVAYMERGVTETRYPVDPGTGIGMVFDTDAVTHALSLRIPAGWDPQEDPELILGVSLDQAETADDDIDFWADWAAITPGVDPWDKAQSTTAVITQDIGAGNADQTLHEVRIPLALTDTGQDLTAGDWVNLTISRPNLSEVGSVTLRGVEIGVKRLNSAD